MTPHREPAREPARDPREELQECRNAIEVVDRRIVTLLAQRVALGLRAADAKRAAGLPLVDPAREAEVVRRAVAEARERALPEGDVEQIFERIIAISRRVQAEPR